MKRLIISMFAIALALSILVLPVIAAEIRNGFVDADQDGICDNRNSCVNFTDEDRDGICDRQRNFAVEDGDGICDFQGSANCGRQRGRGCGQQHRYGN